jgi:hypothetical protein
MKAGCSVATPTLVYAWPTQEEFDKLEVAETLHDWKDDRFGTVLKNDGQEWERRCHSKMIEGSGVMVIFQWFDERPKTHNSNSTTDSV